MAEQKAAVNLDDVLNEFSIFARYHRECLVLLFLAGMANSMYGSYVFVTEEVGYRCKYEGFGNNTCTNPHNSTETCIEWEYDDPHSFVAEFQLACQEWKRSFVGTVQNCGGILGLLLVGVISDRLGRKISVVITGMVSGVIALIKSYTTYYWIYICLAFLETAIGDLYSPMFILATEIVPAKKRPMFLMLSGMGYSIGGAILPLMAWLFPYWRTLLRVIYTPALLFFFYIFLLDESPRWLLSKGKKDEAVAVHRLLFIYPETGITFFLNSIFDLHEKLSYVEDKVDFINVLHSTFKSKILLKRFFICLCWWMTSNFVNEGFLINSISLPGNKYINFSIVNMIEIPSSVLTTYVLIRYNRKIPLILCFTACGLLCGIQAFVPTNLPWLSILLFMAGKFMIASYYYITYVFTSELFPTYTRNSMQAVCTSVGRIASTGAPQTPLLMQYWSGLPSIVFGSVSMLAGLATVFVPDTSASPLPDTIRQAEALGATPNVSEESASDTAHGTLSRGGLN